MSRPPQPEPAKDRSGYLASDTIAAISTALGGAISMVRVSGPRAFQALQGLLPAGEPGIDGEPRKLFRGLLQTPAGEALDDALFVRFVSPESYTGEDLVELHLHGGEFIAARVLETLATLGARQALPGEFSFRAVRNGKMSLSQAQAVADLIAASNEGAVTLALEKMSGTQNRLLLDLAANLRQLAALGEVGIDFSDQEVDEVSLPRLKERIIPLLETLRRLGVSYQRGFRLQEGIPVAFIGLPNAGKSSFFNALLGEDRSIVSEIAGTTRDIVREKITLRNEKTSVTLRLEDTAGLRQTTDTIEKMGIERSRKSATDAELVLFVVDPHESAAAVQDQWSRLGGPFAKTIGILTKKDLLTPAQLTHQRQVLKVLGIPTWVETSAQTGDGIQEAIDQIVLFCGASVSRKPGEVLLTRQDHLAAVLQAVSHLERAQKTPEIDLFASDVKQALHSLSPLIGETVPDDILGKIFSDFCIGK